MHYVVCRVRGFSGFGQVAFVVYFYDYKEIFFCRAETTAAGQLGQATSHCGPGQGEQLHFSTAFFKTALYLHSQRIVLGDDHPHLTTTSP